VSVKSPQVPRTPPPTPPRRRRFSLSEIPAAFNTLSLEDEKDYCSSYADSGQAKSESLSFQETLDQMRESIKKNRDAMARLNYARYLFESAEKIHEDYTQLGLEIPEDEREYRIQKMANLLEQEALNIVKRLATSGPGGSRFPLAEAQLLLGEFLGKGVYGLKVNHFKSFQLYLQASKQNNTEAVFRAAICYELGIGTKQDNQRAIQFYRKASSMGHNLAMHKLSLTLLYGKLGQRKNLKEGISWLKRAANGADVNHPEALHDLAQCFEKVGGCPVLIADEYYAFELYSRGADFGFAPSQFRLGACYEFGALGVEKDPALSITWYSKAAVQGYPEAELALAGWYLDGYGKLLKKDELTSFRWVKKAAERGYPKAIYVLGTYYEKGIGVQKDMNEAVRLFQEAANLGYKRALDKLTRLSEEDSAADSGKAQRRCAIM